MADAEMIEPVEVERDEAGELVLEPSDETSILAHLSAEAIDRLHIRRIGHTLTIGSAEPPLTTGLIHVTSPNDDHYRALMAEAGPGEIPHHPV